MNNILGLFAQTAAATAPAAAAPAAVPSGTPAATPLDATQAAGAAGFGQFGSLIFMVLIFVAFYFILIFPESRRRKKLQQEISQMKSGDKVMTIGGVIGIIDFVGEKTVYIKSQDSKFEVAKESIASIIKNQ